VKSDPDSPEFELHSASARSEPPVLLADPQLRRIVRYASFAYPPLTLAWYHVAWLTAWAVLGHRPRYLLDDPKYIHWSVEIPSLIAHWMTLASFGILPLSALATSTLGWYAGGSSARRLRCILVDLSVLGLCWFGGILYLRADPFGIIDWYFD